MRSYDISHVKYCMFLSIGIIFLGLMSLLGGGEIEILKFSIKLPTANIEIGDIDIPPIFIGVGIMISGIPMGRWCKCEFIIPFMDK